MVLEVGLQPAAVLPLELAQLLDLALQRRTLRLGGVALDLSFFVLMIIVYILIAIVGRL